MRVTDYITEKDAQEFCEKCYDCACTRHCVIFRKAEMAYDQEEKENREK